MKPTHKFELVAVFSLVAATLLNGQSYSIATVAGTNTIQNGIPAVKAFLRYPQAVQVDSKGNIYILDQFDSRVRKIDTKGIITTVAGNGIIGVLFTEQGPALEAPLNGPLDMAVDRKGLNLYIADTGNNRVRRVDLTTGTITTIAGNGSSKYSGDGGPATRAGVIADSVAVDDAGNVYVGDANGGARVRKIDAVTGLITTLAGNGMVGWSGDQGAANQAEVAYPWSLTTDHQYLYIADPGISLVRRIDLTSHIITRYAGVGYLDCPVDNNNNCLSTGDGGDVLHASFAGPTYVNADEAGNLLIMDSLPVNGYPSGGNLRFIAAGATAINFVAGSPVAGYAGDGTGGLGNVRFESPYGVALAGQANYLIADGGNYRLRQVQNGAIEAIAGFSSPDGLPATQTVLNYPVSAVVDPTGNLFIADSQNERVRKAAAGTGIVSTVLGTGYGNELNNGLPFPTGTAVGPNGVIYVGSYDRIMRIDATGAKAIAGLAGSPGFSGDGSVAYAAMVSNVNGIRLDSQGNIYFADTGNFRVRRIDGTNGVMTTVAGNGNFSAKGENVAATSVGIWPWDVDVDAGGNLYIVDAGIPRIRKVAAGSGLITTVAGGVFGIGGDGGPAAKAGLLSPTGVSVDASGDLFIADPDTYTIRRVDGRTGIITRVAGTGDNLHLAETGAALMTSIQPTSVLVQPDGSLLVGDAGNDRIRKLTLQTAKAMTIASGNNQTGATGASVPIAVKIVDATGLPVATVPVTFTVASGSAQVAPSTVMTIGDGTATTNVTLGQTLGPVTVTASASGLTSVAFTLTVALPFINGTNGVTGLPMSNPPVAALSGLGLMQISGQGFLPARTAAGVVGDSDLVSGALPTVYKTVCVTVGGTPAPLLAVSSKQIVFQTPVLTVGGTADVSVTTACGTGQDLQSAAVTLPVQAEAPEFFYVQQNADGTSLVGAMNNATGEQALTSQPGDSVTVYLTGLGSTSPAANPGDVISANLGVNANVTIQLGAETIAPDWVTTPSSLPGAPYVTQIGENAGVYLIQFTIPADAPAGNLPLVAMTDDGTMSPAGAYLAIQAPTGGATTQSKRPAAAGH